MPIRNQNWYDLQATRRYPLDDRSTGIDDNGGLIRDNILVDCHIRYPDTLGDFVYVQGITVSAGLVTLVFGVAASLSATGGTSIAAVTLPLPITQNINYPVRDLYPGVAGWVVLGPGVAEPFSGRYSTAAQSLVAARNARAYRPLPVSSLRKVSTAAGLTDVVNIAAAAPIVVTRETITVGGSEKQALVFRLNGAVGDEEALKYFLGPCGQRPESGTCPKPAIETINGLQPDCDGNINFEFDGFTGYPYVNCGGVDIVSDIGLSEACYAGAPKSRRRSQDKCNLTSDSLDDANWYDPLTPTKPGTIIISSESLPDEGYPPTCATVPVCVDFSSGTAPDFVVKKGLFVFDQTTTPGTCASPPAYGSGLLLTTNYAYASADIVGVNIALYKNCPSDWAIGRKVSTDLQVNTDGLDRNGGLVLNYIRGNPNIAVPTTYIAAVIDCMKGQLRLLRFNGSRFVNEYSTEFETFVNKWYRLSAEPTLSGSNVVVTVRAEAADDSVSPVQFAVTLSQYGAAIGQAGFFSNRSYTYFNAFRIEN